MIFCVWRPQKDTDLYQGTRRRLIREADESSDGYRLESVGIQYVYLLPTLAKAQRQHSRPGGSVAR